MARINLEDSIYSDRRFHRLLALVGNDTDRAIGALARGWALAQKWFTTDDRMIPVEEWRKQEISDHLLTADLAVQKGDKIRVRGAEKQFGWLLQRQNAGRGNKGKSRKRPTSGGNGSERLESSFSFSSSDSFSDSVSKDTCDDPKVNGRSQGELLGVNGNLRGGKPLGSQIFEAYRQAFTGRWNVEPVRNARVNSLCAQLGHRLGPDAADVAAFYLKHNDGLYVRQQHPLSLFVRDAESLHTQWKRGRAVTTAEVRSFEKASQTQSQLERIEAGDL